MMQVITSPVLHGCPRRNECIYMYSGVVYIYIHTKTLPRQSTTCTYENKKLRFWSYGVLQKLSFGIWWYLLSFGNVKIEQWTSLLSSDGAFFECKRSCVVQGGWGRHFLLCWVSASKQREYAIAVTTKHWQCHPNKT